MKPNKDLCKEFCLQYFAQNSLLLKKIHMNAAVCNLAVVPLRALASEKSEMVSQLVFGESADIVEKSNDWAYLRTHYDGYEGWCSLNQLAPLTNNDSDKNESPYAVVSSKTAIIKLDGQEKLLSFGSSIPQNSSSAESEIQVVEGKIRRLPIVPSLETFIEDALNFVGIPYLWGGRSIFGADCSGFLQLLCKANGIQIPRDAYMQAEIGETLSFIDEAREGDLVFFDNEEGRIIHVGIVLNGKNVIHASGFVRIDKIDHYGIFNQQNGNYTHKLRIIKRIFH